MKLISNIAAWIFGAGLVGLALFVTADVIARKFFGLSFEGADELGGYVLAVGAALAFLVALVVRAHMRIDVIYARLPVAPRAVLDWVSLFTLTCMAGLMVWLGWKMLRDSMAYHSSAPTPWATPLAWPQGVWLSALALFFLITAGSLIIATRDLVRGRWREVNARFGSSAEKDELDAELADLKRRR
ncbi:TRAP-type C4-dicarboxylate transport system permease small subunit [Breoghania corrubedonensis]|uniref:TRAP transporter small permease protein n=1 Tax=Breoghania corrubedonensis TaxID=665038 RepID=A0A2T5V6D3_9HYPH|nr:TRAP transporter small permease [Breoghania corrubedonensis]PTW59313.1 TRAP-type C4-dicarboxylate transport system permease small subunit [Breoghania corrubedonensis]